MLGESGRSEQPEASQRRRSTDARRGARVRRWLSAVPTDRVLGRASDTE